MHDFLIDWTDDYETSGGVSQRDAIIGITCGVLFGVFLGFMIAMRHSRTFNVAVRKSIMPRSVQNSQVFTSRNSLLGSEAMPMLFTDEDMEQARRVT